MCQRRKMGEGGVEVESVDPELFEIKGRSVSHPAMFTVKVFQLEPGKLVVNLRRDQGAPSSWPSWGAFCVGLRSKLAVSYPLAKV